MDSVWKETLLAIENDTRVLSSTSEVVFRIDSSHLRVSMSRGSRVEGAAQE